eukprot:CAMPEP_0197245252 /NCGR_PEP_ID=MMETSP1429-20130617/10094_1 /TAXON_ID=49237 /ORGANISM="Chaetoceros  sp., Strain UNC1202" /LENGTH=73 /DNA_ID=CAMNT_0042705711 /DNA_START=431 /DNA_END=652 /DNA_ORIENTATION=+
MLFERARSNVALSDEETVAITNITTIKEHDSSSSEESDSSSCSSSDEDTVAEVLHGIETEVRENLQMLKQYVG